MEKIIGLDCHPGNPRPDDLLPQVIKRLLPIKKPVSKLFGAFEWDYSEEVSDEQWRNIQPVLKKRIAALYRKRIIRGAIISKSSE